jgi:hypothetical protein
MGPVPPPYNLRVGVYVTEVRRKQAKNKRKRTCFSGTLNPAILWRSDTSCRPYLAFSDTIPLGMVSKIYKFNSPSTNDTE